MRWRDYRTSDNIEDRRGMSVGGRGVAIGGGGLLLLVVFSLLTGQDPGVLLEMLQPSDTATVDQSAEPGRIGAPTDDLGRFASVVLASTEDVWREVLPQQGVEYEPPRLVLFSDAVASACGMASSAVGPFYCPPDRRVYLDLSFFDELDRRFGAPGDFAQAYVIAHEIGHHVQNLLGISDKVRRAQRSDRETANALSVRLELQADCLAGVWGRHANQRANLLEPGDVDEGLRAAAAIGDDRLQRKAAGTVQPESWTHGSSAMRSRWLRRGLESGDPAACDTFAAREL
ncbi:MAG TPA: neutral zinc metallopeptidase [Candidatus Binatia bacterium]|nr:neutral zinc metallopeptidase [Candidatus Binatia bacterium]